MLRLARRAGLFFALATLAGFPNADLRGQGAVAVASASAAETVVARYRELLLSKYASRPGHWDADAAASWIDTLDANGAWPDIDYASASPGAWPTLSHLQRIRILARELADPASALHNDVRAERAALQALDHWTRHRYQNPNWWQNRIAVPQVMRDAVVLLRPRLSEARLRDALTVIGQVIVHKPGDGANTIWTADIALVTAALKGDAGGVAFASERIAGEIGVGKKEGIQDDFSFHQHGPRLQQFHYGVAFFRDTVRVAWLLRDTPWAFPPETTGLLADYLSEGGRWMSRGEHTVPGTVDRAVSRVGGLRAARLGEEPAMLADLLPARREEFETLRRIQSAGGPYALGFRAFPRSDFAAYHRPAFSFFLKTLSPRTRPTETLLRENLRGSRLGWGDHYLLTDRANYDELPPVWDWDLLPGVTASSATKRLLPTSFNGGLGDTRSGLFSTHHRLQGSEGSAALDVRKLWALHGDLVLVLIDGPARAAASEPLRTALDQRRLSGPVTLGAAHGETRVLAEGRHRLDDVAWLHHDGLAYLPLAPSTLAISLGPVTGSWRDINLNQPAEPVTVPVFLPVLEHRAAPASVAADAADGYVLAAAPAPSDAAALAARPTWEVLRNDAAGQALRFADGVIMVAFHRAGKLSAPDLEIEADQACLLLIGSGQLHASDPTHQGKTVRVRVGDRVFTIACPPGGRASAPVPMLM